MSQPVWVLSVDLQTKTATFQSGMADAAKAARGSFNEIKEGAGSMASETGYKMSEARHGVMLLGEEFGIHLPRALTSFIASLGPIGAAMEAAFPFLAIVVGATLLLEHLSKMREAGEKLTESQIQFGTTVSNVLTGLDNKLLQAGIRADELNHNHLGALNKQLELIDHQSMNELVHAFDTVAKAADLSFAQLKTSWYQFGAGSTGAKHALEQFKTEYDSLLARGKDKEANDLLSGTLQSAEKILALQKQASSKTPGSSGAGEADAMQFYHAKAELQRLGAGFTEKEVTAQQMLVDSLHAQEEVQTKITALKAMESSNAKQSTQVSVDKDSDTAAKQQADAARKELDEANKLWEENYRRAVSALQENEREKIEATERGSAERLQAIDAAIKEENSKGLQETGFYKSLLKARIDVAKEMENEEKKQRAEAGKEASEQEFKMGELALQATRQADQLKMSAHRVTAAEQAALDRQYADDDFKLKQKKFSDDIAALDKSDKDYENKLKQLQDKQLQLVREHENQVTQIKNRAEEERNARILSGENRFNDEIARGLTSTLMRHESIGKMMVSIGDTVASGMMQNAIKSVMANDFTKESDAAAAARKAFLAGWHFPWPVNIVMGPALGAMAFAAAMAFEGGGIVPGVERGDVVPARLTPGETVIPKAMTEKLQRAADPGSDRGDVHVHHHATYHVNAIDGASVRGMLDKHGDEFTRHVTSTLRKMNR